MADKVETTQQGAQEKLEGLKPVIGGGPGSGAMFLGGNRVAGNPSDLTRRSPDINNEEARIGDYVVQGNQAVVVPNSKTDYVQRYSTISGGQEKFDWSDPTGEILAQSGGAIAAGAKMGGLPGAGIATLLTLPFAMAGTMQASREHDKAIDNWRNQAVTLETFVQFDDKNNRAIIDSNAMSKPYDSRAGQGIKDIQETETKVEMNDKNEMNIQIAPAFANTAQYKEIVKMLSTNLKGLTKDHPDYEKILKQVHDMLESSKSRFEYESIRYDEYKDTVPDATDEYVRKAYLTELGGYLNEDQMAEYEVTVMRDGKEVQLPAKQVLDEFYEKDVWGRDKHLAELDETINSEETTNEEKALALGEYRLISAASHFEGAVDDEGKATETKYKGMTRKSFWDSLFTNVIPFSEYATNAFFGTSGDHLEEDPIGNSLPVKFAGGFSRAYIAGKTMQGISNVIRHVPGISAVGKWTPKSNVVNNVKEAAYGFTVDLAADVVYDAAESGIAVLSGESDNFQEKFWNDLGRDIVIDAAMSGMGSVQLKSSLARRPTGLEWAESNSSAISDAILKNDSMFEVPLEKHKGIDVYSSSKLVNTDEVGSKIAKKLGDLEANAKIGKFREAFMDKNEALSAEAMRAYGATQDKNLYLKGINSSTSMKQNTGYELQKINSGYYKNGTDTSWLRFQESLVAHNRNGKITKAEKNYLVAIENLKRYRAVFAGDAANLKTIENFYKPYIDAVPAKDRVQLDKLLANTKEWLKDVGDSYVKSGAGSALQLEAMRDGEVWENVGWIPLWAKTKAKKGETFEIWQERATGRNWTNVETLYKPEDIESPIVSSLKWGNNVAHNIAINERNKTIIELAEAAGDIVKTNNNPTEINSKTIKNLNAIEKKYNEISEATKEKVRRQVPTQEEHRKAQDKIIEKSGLDKAVDKYFTIKGRNKAKERTVALNDIQSRAADIARKLEAKNKVYRKDGLVDIEDYIKNRLTPNLAEAIRTNEPAAVERVIAEAAKEINPYFTYEQVLSSAIDADAVTFRTWVEDNVKLNKSQMEFKDDIVTNIMAKLGASSPDNYASGVAVKAIEDKNGGIVSYFDENNNRMSFFVQGEIGSRLSKLANDPDTMVERSWLNNAARRAANAKRVLTTGVDPARWLPNLMRDMVRGLVTTGGDIFPNARQLLDDLIKAEGFSKTEIERINSSLDMVVERIKGETLNASLEVADKFRGKELARAVVERNAKRPVRYIWELRNDKLSILKKPMDAIEGFTRGKITESAFTRSMYQSANSGASLENRIEVAMREARFAGAESTTNFSRKGRMIEKVAQHVPYFATAFSGLESLKLAVVNDPVGVSYRFAELTAAYIYLMADTLSDDEKRKNYYNLSEYDRANNIIISIDKDTLFTIPLDESLAGMLFYPRRLMETWQGIDPITWDEVVFGGLLAISPLDLGGFTEGDTFNIQRGLERIGIQAMPTLLTGAAQVATGRDWFFGSDIRVTDEDLEQYGNYSPTPGDYTTVGRNSKTLRWVADHLGIPQWQLQTLIGHYGGNVGQYVVNTIDKLAGASEDEQGGKDFVDAVFKPFTGMDSQNAKSQFYNGINKLRDEKGKVKNTLQSIEEDMQIASGSELAQLRKKYQQTKDDYATKVADFVNQYLQAFEITGGLPRSQAMQIYYLFRFDDDKSFAEPGSPEEYYRDLANQQASNTATALAAPIVDKAYPQVQQLFQDTDGNWHYKSSFSERAFYNTLYGKGVKHEIAMRNILEGKDETLKNAKKAMQNARTKALKANDFKTYEKLALDFDKQVIDAIAPYVNQYGAEEVIGDSKVLDYLEDWFVVPSNWMTTKKGRYVPALGKNASKQQAYVKPYIKYLFGLDTGYSNYREVEKLTNQPLNR